MPQTSPPTDNMMLKDYAPVSELVVDQTLIERAKFPTIDAHNHLGFLGQSAEAADQAVAEMDACNVKAMIDLDGGRLAPLAETLAITKQRHPGRFYTLTILPWDQIMAEGGDVGGRLAAALEDAVNQGADGLKIHKTLGLRIKDDNGQLVMPDDPRLATLFDKCAELKVPCLIHVADPVAFFKPLDRSNERWEELIGHPSWHFYGDPYPSYQQLMDAQERMVERHPDTIFQSAHVASAAENLGYVSTLLARYRNLYVDISARVGELGRQPYTARKFFIDHADRVLYGTDVTPCAASHRIVMRFLETHDEYFDYGIGETPGQGRWQIYGIGLPDDVLEKVYCLNAERIYGQSKDCA